jgi:hypothetical protein
MMDELRRRLAGRVSAFALFTQRETRAAEFYRNYGFVEDTSLRFMLLGIEPHGDA